VNYRQWRSTAGNNLVAIKQGNRNYNPKHKSHKIQKAKYKIIRRYYPPITAPNPTTNNPPKVKGVTTHTLLQFSINANGKTQNG
jgi:hypothetical protein